jgi:hypothetical protein
MKNIFFIATAALFVTGPAAAEEPRSSKRIERVEINGMSFKVVVRGDTATAERRGFAFRLSADLYINAKLAIETVSGCLVTEGFPDLGLYAAKLDCSGARQDQ